MYIKLLNSRTDMQGVSSLALAHGHVAYTPITSHVSSHNLKDYKAEQKLNKVRLFYR